MQEEDRSLSAIIFQCDCLYSPIAKLAPSSGGQTTATASWMAGRTRDNKANGESDEWVVTTLQVTTDGVSVLTRKKVPSGTDDRYA